MNIGSWLSRNQSTWQRAANLNVGGQGPKPGYKEKVRKYLAESGRPQTVGEVALATGLTIKQTYAALRSFAIPMAGGIWRMPE